MNNDKQTQLVRNNPRVISTVAYFSLVGWLIVMFFLNRPKDEFVNFHIRQALGVNLFFIACSIVFVLPFLGWIVGAAGYILGAIMWLVGIVSAIRGDIKVAPVLGELFQEWFPAL